MSLPERHCPTCSTNRKIVSDIRELNSKLQSENNQLRYVLREMQKQASVLRKAFDEMSALFGRAGS